MRLYPSKNLTHLGPTEWNNSILKQGNFEVKEKRDGNGPGGSDLAETQLPLPRILAVMLRPQGSPARATGGGQILIIQTAVALRELGAKVCMLEGAPSILSGYAQVLEAYSLSSTRKFLSDTVGLVRTVRKTKSDSIYAFTDFYPETIVPCLLTSLITRKKLIVNILNRVNYTKDGEGFLGLIAGRVREGHKMRAALAFAIYHASRRLACRIGACLVQNHFMESYASSRLHARRTFVVGAGVESFWYGRTDAEKLFDCVYSGRFDPTKRVSTLIRAWQIVVKNKQNARLLLIGESGKEFLDVKRLVDDLGLAPNVVFAGFIEDRLDLADRIGSARVFAFPSVQEGFGLVIAEAMAAGLPCVLSDVEPFREVFGEAALLVNADEPPAFAEAILGLLQDENRSNDYSARSSSLARRFSWSAVAEKILTALERW